MSFLTKSVSPLWAWIPPFQLPGAEPSCDDEFQLQPRNKRGNHAESSILNTGVDTDNGEKCVSDHDNG